jgi:hypothetical protein
MCVERLQAWYIGQSADFAQPHCPFSQWYVPVQVPHDVPIRPHWVSLMAVWQTPEESQHPVAQLAEVHLSTQPLPIQV